jgi:hypothetical protein
MKMARKSAAQTFAFVAATLMVTGILLARPSATPAQQDKRKDSMAGMDMSGEDMSNMGPSMAAMAGHMEITPVQPKQPGDEQKARDIVSKLKVSIERYKDFRKAVADGYAIANPKLEQPQYHFVSKANTREADVHFDLTKPTALLYRRTPTQRYLLEGVMYTASPDATEAELNERIPLSIGRWHRHVNFCAAPDSKGKDYQAEHPKFGMFGSIKTAEACAAEGGTFHPHVFTWMLHVFPYEEDFKNVFSLNDDVPHVH